MDDRLRTSGFTLIELLVVVTIIVVLLALLTPALDKAFYAAEMVQDGAQMRGVAQATIAYTTEHKKAYPGPYSTWDAMQIRNSSHWNIPGLLSAYVPAKIFMDPFLANGNLDYAACMSDPYGVYMPGYHWYPNWGTASAPNINPMKRMGQKMVFMAPEGDIRKFGVILADRDARVPGSWATTSHQDKEGRQTLWAYQGGGNPWIAQGLGPVVGPATGNVYVAWWIGTTRSTVDENFALDDGSVLRLDDVPAMATLDDDPRMSFIPDTSVGEYNSNRKAQLPRAVD
jgi:prepilin-type N-terminal cleavage/methylation domain-containing protein